MKVAFLTTDNREDSGDYSSPVPYFGTAPEALLQGLAALGELEIHVVSCGRAQMNSPAKLAENIFFHGLHVPRTGWLRTAYQGCIRAVRRKLREIGPEIAHGQGTERDCALSAVFSGFPSVVTIHGNMRTIARISRARPFSFLWLAARLEAFTISRAQGVLCASRHTQQTVSGQAKRTWLLPNAVDPAFFQLERQASPGAAPRILCVGNVYGLKNQNALIRALTPVADKQKLDLVFLGKAREQDLYATEFFGLIRARSWCTYLGFATRDELKAQLRQATLLALPSLEENCPMAVLEAMAAGVPVAAARVGGVPDLIYSGKTGFLFEPLDEGSIRTTIQTVLTNPVAALEAAGEAKRLARERFHPNVIAQRHVEIYREVSAQKARPVAP